MTERAVVDAVRSAAEDRRFIEIVGRGEILPRFAQPPECDRIEMSGLQGITSYEPEEFTVTVRPGTPVAELSEVLAASGQECPLEGPGSSIGGRIASGLSGVRRLGLGHIREWLLGGRLVTGEGVAVRFGAPVVKNVSGYDLPRLLCGSWGTLGVLTELTLRVRPRPRYQGWFLARDDPTVARRVTSPAAMVRTPEGIFLLLEGHPKDCAEEARRLNLAESDAPSLPSGVRISVPPRELDSIISDLASGYGAELGVGIIHADLPDDAFTRIEEAARALGGRALIFNRFAPQSQLLSVAGGVADFTERVKRAFDPLGLFAPWRLSA